MVGREAKTQALNRLLFPVIIALLVGGSSPWWWRFFVERPIHGQEQEKQRQEDQRRQREQQEQERQRLAQEAEESAWTNAKFVGTTQDRCRNGQVIVVNGVSIPEQTNREIRLPSAVTELRWECGGSRNERVANDVPFDKVFITRFDGDIRWDFYKK